MAVKGVDAETVLAGTWEELRTALVEWDDWDEDAKGFESELGFLPSPDWKRSLAEAIK